MQGIFIVFEGGDGVGKSTQAALLAEWLDARGREVVRTFEPGDGPVNAQIRHILLSRSTENLSPRAEALLFAADKAQHVASLVLPALDRGAVVVSDRYVDSTLAYQGAGRVLDMGEVERMNRWATDELRPDLTVLLDLDPTMGLAGIAEAIAAAPGAEGVTVETVDSGTGTGNHFAAVADADIVVTCTSPTLQTETEPCGDEEALHA